jgi:hypothetical protein
MKKRLLFILAICISVSSFAAPWDIKSQKSVPLAWDKPFEVVTINWYEPTWYPANYWHWGQAAGYFFYIDLSGVQEATWELSIDIETTIGNVTSSKTFVFTIPGGGGTYAHAHALSMASQMVSGETIADSPPMTINHWWIVS